VTALSEFWQEATLRYRPEWEGLVEAWVADVLDKHKQQAVFDPEPLATENAAYQTVMRLPFPISRYIDTIKTAGSRVIQEQVETEVRAAARKLGWPVERSLQDILIRVATGSVLGRTGG